MGKIATQEDFNNFIQADKKNIPIILRGVFSKDDANKVKANWRKYAKANGFNENIDHLKNNAENTLDEYDNKKHKRKSKY